MIGKNNQISTPNCNQAGRVTCDLGERSRKKRKKDQRVSKIKYQKKNQDIQQVVGSVGVHRDVASVGHRSRALACCDLLGY